MLNRKERRTLLKRGKPEAVGTAMYKQGFDDANAKATLNTLIMACWVLHDNFDFGCRGGAKKLHKFFLCMQDIAECVNAKTVKVTELRQALIDDGFKDLEIIKVY